MATYVYRQDKEGNVRRLLLSERMPYKVETAADLKTRMMKTMYDLECKQGSNFQGTSRYSKETLKRVWENAPA